MTAVRASQQGRACKAAVTIRPPFRGAANPRPTFRGGLAPHALTVDQTYRDQHYHLEEEHAVTELEQPDTPVPNQAASTASQRPRVYDETDDVHRVSGPTSQPAVYRDPDSPSYDKTWPDPDGQLHTVVPGSTEPPAVASSDATLSQAQPAPVQDVGIPIDVPDRAASAQPAGAPTAEQTEPPLDDDPEPDDTHGDLR